LKLLYVFFTIFIIFAGCSSKEITPHSENIKYQDKNLTTQEDELFDEFEDEVTIEDRFDPLKAHNIIITEFNDILYVYILSPVTSGYNKVVHYDIRKSIRNFFNNVYFPVRVTNNFLQGKFKNTSEETGRFIVNSTIGILGLFDPAKSYFNLEAHEEDFGQTLGFYGVGSGPHIVLPFFGPSNLRDAISIIPDSFLSPIDYKTRDWITLTNNWDTFLTLKALEYTNDFSLDVIKYNKLREDSIDLYPYFRDVYEQYRDKQIRE